MKKQGQGGKNIPETLWIFSDLFIYINAVFLPLVFLETRRLLPVWLSQLQPPACCQTSLLPPFLHVIPLTPISFPQNLLPPPAPCLPLSRLSTYHLSGHSSIKYLLHLSPPSSNHLLGIVFFFPSPSLPEFTAFHQFCTCPILLAFMSPEISHITSFFLLRIFPLSEVLVLDCPFT